MECLMLFNLRQRSRDSDPRTQTVIDQIETEQLVRKAYYERLGTWKNKALRLFRLNHISYLTRMLVNLPTSFEHLDASQPWLAYWMVHSLRLLNFTIPTATKAHLIHFLKSTQYKEGGFGGGAYQFAHLATTYGAVNCLVSLCQQDALDVIDRPALIKWLQQLHQEDGSFIMHIGGEADLRGVYCALAVAKLTGIYTSHPELFSASAEWVASCQTYEGGFGAQPGIEAHGGYTFCAVAALCLLQRPDLIDIPRLLRWVAFRQMSNEGGFQGRTNKLVDSCYSFWQGAVFPIVEELLCSANDRALLADESLFNVLALQEYILLCCQKVSFTRPGLSVPAGESPDVLADSEETACIPLGGGGGLIDKPGRNVDCYHTCYALSGLSMAQHCPRPRCCVDPVDDNAVHFSLGLPNRSSAVESLCGDPVNELADLDPLHNVLHDGLTFALTYFQQLDSKKSPEESTCMATEAMEKCYTPILRSPMKADLPSPTSHSPQSDHFMYTCVTP